MPALWLTRAMSNAVLPVASVAEAEAPCSSSLAACESTAYKGKQYANIY
jgi:hypothetical protein